MTLWMHRLTTPFNGQELPRKEMRDRDDLKMRGSLGSCNG
jgi:hypothetical protein